MSFLMRVNRRGGIALGFALFFIIFSALAGMGCGRKTRLAPQDQSSKKRGGEVLSATGSGILAHSDVPREQREYLKQDFSRLNTISLEEDPELSSLLGLEAGNLSGPTLSSWLAERVRYIVPSDFSESLVSEVSPVSAQRNVVVIMVNLGTAIYNSGKARGRLYSVKFEDREIVINTPRVGLVKIGEGLFKPSYEIQGHGLDSFGTTLNRLSVLFHEARHSDGNGENAGFPHTMCPPDHPYAGREQCESMSNGAFSLEAGLLDAFIRTCENNSLCDVTEIEALRLNFADARTRLLPGAQEALDPSPEKIEGGRLTEARFR